MKLATYLKRKGITQTAFADELGVSQGLVWQWLKGETTITAERAMAIEKATGGLVSRGELRSDIFGPLDA